MSTVEDHNPFAPPLAAVADVPPAGPVVLARRSSRLWAGLVDAGLAFIVGGVGGLAVGMAHGRPNFVFQAVLVALILTIQGWFLYHWGQSVGKRVVGLRIVRRDGSRVSFPRVFFARTVVPAAIEMLPVAGPFLAIVDVLFIFRASRRCVHDDLADTIVVTAASSEHATLAGARAGLPVPSA